MIDEEDVPAIVLRDFLSSAKEELKSLKVDKPRSPASIRLILLECQQDVLERVVAKHNSELKKSYLPPVSVGQVEVALKDLREDELINLSREMNETARLVYAKLVLYSASRSVGEQRLQDQMKLTASGRMQRKDLMELFALCQAAVRLPLVKEHVMNGTQLFDDLDQDEGFKTAMPQKRLERIQRLFLVALGYDADFGTLEIKRIFLSPESSELTGDQELFENFGKTVSAQRALITHASVQDSLSKYSDVGSGGFTRVVAVDYSEKWVDSNGTVHDDSHGQTMEEHVEERQRQNLRVASQAAALQQKLLKELLAMEEEERKVRLAEADRASKDFIQEVMSKPPGPERIQALRSVDESTQRLLAMHKLWEAHVAASTRTES